MLNFERIRPPQSTPQSNGDQKVGQLDAKFFKPFIEGAINTLKIQCGLTATTEKPFIKGQTPQPDFAIAGMIGITSVGFNGSITICFPKAVFLGVMSKMLGEECKEITEDLQDGVAELLNMIFGQAKIVLNAQGHAIQMAIPSVVRGDKISTRSMSKSTVIVMPIMTPVGEFHVEVCSEIRMP